MDSKLILTLENGKGRFEITLQFVKSQIVGLENFINLNMKKLTELFLFLKVMLFGHLKV